MKFIVYVTSRFRITEGRLVLRTRTAPEWTASRETMEGGTAK